MPAVDALDPPDPLDPLDNAVWHSLTGPLRSFAECVPDGSGANGVATAARFAPEVSPFGALVDHPDPSAWAELARLVGPGSVTVVFRGDVVVPAGWTRLDGGEGIQMVGPEVAGTFDPEATELGAADADEVLDLIARTQPGPFATRTLEVGRYVGIRRRGRLVAMAGERLRIDGQVEVSAVCTDADHRGRGLARRLVSDVVAGAVAGGDVPFLHVAATNHGAQRVYRDLGFRERRRVQWVALRAPAPDARGG